MKAVGDLLGLWCSQGRTGSVIAAAIATDEPHLGMLLQPQRKAQLRAVGQQINDAMRFQIQEDGAIRSATPERKVVYTQHRHRCRDWLWVGLRVLTERKTTPRDAVCIQQAA